MIRLMASALLALALAAPAFAQSGFTRHTLTVALLEKHQAATRELEKLEKTVKMKSDDDDKDGVSVDEFAKELDTTPGVKPILARHGLTSRAYALTAIALFEAGFHLMMEPTMGNNVKQALASYPAEMRANIELLRKNPQLLKK